MQTDNNEKVRQLQEKDNEIDYWKQLHENVTSRMNEQQVNHMINTVCRKRRTNGLIYS